MPNASAASIKDREYSTRDILAAVVFCGVVFVLLWLRRPDSLLNSQFWAEDGTIFFKEQVMFGIGKTIALPYSGYLHTVPRLIAVAMCALPVRWVPLGFSVSAMLIAAISCGLFFLPCYRRIVASDALRGVCCVLVAVTNPLAIEMIGAVCNLQWYLSVFSLLLIAAGEREVTSKAAEIVFSGAQVLVALTAPATLLFSPFLLWQAKNKQGWLKVRPLVHMAALGLQAWIMFRSAAPGAKPLLHFNSLFLATVITVVSRCVLAPSLGLDYLTRDSVIALLTKLVIALIVCVVMVIILILRLRESQRLQWLLAALYVGFGSVLLVMAGRRLAPAFLSVYGIQHSTGERYFFIGASMFIFCATLAIDTLVWRRNQALAAILLTGVFALGIIHNFSVAPMEDFHWDVSAPRIERWEAARKRHERVDTLLAPINPPEWNVTLDGDK